MPLSRDYVEAIILWGPGGSSPAALQWFQRRGFQVHPMRAGILVSASRGTFEKAFGVNLATATPPVSVPIPEALREFTASIVIPAPRRPHSYKSTQ